MKASGLKARDSSGTPTARRDPRSGFIIIIALRLGQVPEHGVPVSSAWLQAAGHAAMAGFSPVNGYESTNEMRAEYDFSNAIQGKHHRAFAEGTNVVLLEPDVARVYRDSASVNKALRLLMDLARNQTNGSAQSEHKPERMLPSRR